jgi:hypothetical protein
MYGWRSRNAFADAGSEPTPRSSNGFLNWFTNIIWETLKGKREENKRVEAKAAINILLVLCHTPRTITEPPPRNDAAGYQA